MKASLVILLLTSFALLSYGQIAGSVNEAAPPPAEGENLSGEAEAEPAADAPAVPAGTTTATGQTGFTPTRRNPTPVSFKLMC